MAPVIRARAQNLQVSVPARKSDDRDTCAVSGRHSADLHWHFGRVYRAILRRIPAATEVHHRAFRGLEYDPKRSRKWRVYCEGVGFGDYISGLFQFLESGTRTDMSSISLGSSSTTRRLSACLEMETNGSHISARRLLLMRSYMSWPKRQHDPQSTVAKFIISAPKSCTVKNSISRICERLKVTPTLEFTGGEKGWTGDNPFIFGYDQGAKNGLEFRANHSHAVERTVDWLVANQWVFRK